LSITSGVAFCTVTTTWLPWLSVHMHAPSGADSISSSASGPISTASELRGTPPTEAAGCCVPFSITSWPSALTAAICCAGLAV
jgi:hypothetical protein